MTLLPPLLRLVLFFLFFFLRLLLLRLPPCSCPWKSSISCTPVGLLGLKRLRGCTRPIRLSGGRRDNGKPGDEEDAPLLLGCV